MDMAYRCIVVYLLAAAVVHCLEQNTVFPSVVVQLSDLHVSKYQETLPWGNITGDLGLFRDSVLRRIDPDTLIITGDLTDGKSVEGGGQQHEEEWMVYRNLLDPVRVTCPILDVRGNHDSFNIHDPLYDYYQSYSASPKRLKTARVSVHALVDGHLYGFEDGLTKMQKCPVAVFFGIDASAALGLKSPTNFVALMNSKDVSEAAAEADKVIHILQTKGCQHTSIISYGHYPLSTFSTMADAIDARWYDVGLLGALRHALGSVHSMDNSMARLVLETAHVYVSGHLHAAFGERLHRVHTILETESYLTELETAAWKDDRRFRIVVIEGDAQCMSFEDLYFNTKTSPRMRKIRDGAQRDHVLWNTSFSKHGWALTTASDGLVTGSIPVVTWPLDARYSICDDKARPGNEIRSLVLVLDDFEIHNVTLNIYFDKQATNLMRSMRMDMVSRVGQRLLYRSNPKIISSEESEKTVYIQVSVFVREEDGTVSLSSVSQTRTAMLQCHKQEQVCTIEPYQGREALVLSAIEKFTLAVNWPNVAHRMYLTLYCALLLMLVIPKAVLMTRYRDNILRLHGNLLKGAHTYSLRRYILLPCTSLCILSTNTWLWRCILWYLVYLVCGPLYVADLLSGHSLFVVFHHGVVGYVNDEWVIVPTPDVLLVQVMHLLLCIGPMLLWLALAIGHRQGPGGQYRGRMTVVEILSLGLIVAINTKVVYTKAYILMGYQCLLLSPGFAWTIPLVLLAVRRHLRESLEKRDASKGTKSS